MSDKLKKIVKDVAKKFQYTKDKVSPFTDFWFVMEEENGRLKGDCDDFSVTCIWELCDRSLLKFALNVFILHRYRFWRCKTVKDGYHIVGEAEGLWFDNWTREAVSKEELIKRTKHEFLYFYPSPLIMYFMFFGKLFGRHNK